MSTCRTRRAAKSRPFMRSLYRGLFIHLVPICRLTYITDTIVYVCLPRDGVMLLDIRCDAVRSHGERNGRWLPPALNMSGFAATTGLVQDGGSACARRPVGCPAIVLSPIRMGDQ